MAFSNSPSSSLCSQVKQIIKIFTTSYRAVVVERISPPIGTQLDSPRTVGDRSSGRSSGSSNGNSSGSRKSGAESAETEKANFRLLQNQKVNLDELCSSLSLKPLIALALSR